LGQIALKGKMRRRACVAMSQIATFETSGGVEFSVAHAGSSGIPRIKGWKPSRPAGVLRDGNDILEGDTTMKITVLRTALAAMVVVGGVGSLHAESEMKNMRHGMGMQPSFEELDADADGKITPEEMAAQMQARFEGADGNGDGALSRDELIARMTERQAERIAAHADHMIERHDTDGDGMISPDEMKAGRDGRMFKRADTDGDGAISKAEFDAMREDMRARHQAKKAKQ